MSYREFLKQVEGDIDHIDGDTAYLLSSYIPKLIALIEKLEEQRDFYLRVARDEFDAKLAKKTDEAELDAIVRGEG